MIAGTTNTKTLRYSKKTTTRKLGKKNLNYSAAFSSFTFTNFAFTDFPLQESNASKAGFLRKWKVL